MNTYSYVRQLEREHKWREASKEWKALNRLHDAEICEFIAIAVEEGNDFRQRVNEECGPEPNQNDHYAWVKWFTKMDNIYKEMFPDKIVG